MSTNKTPTINNGTRASAFIPYLALFLLLFAVYLLTYTPRINSSDGIAMFATAENLVRRGALDIEQIRWMDLQQGTYGLDGLLYSRKGIGLPVALLPLTWLGLVSPWFGPVSAGLLFNAIVTALTGVLLLAYVSLLGFGQRTGMIVALTFGLATPAWTYAKSLFSDPFSGFLLLAAALALLKYYRLVSQRDDKVKKEVDSYPLPLLLRYPIRFRWYFVNHLHYPFLAGLFLGWNVATRYAEVLFVPVFGILLLYYLGMFKSRRILFWVRYPAPNPWPPIVAFSIPIVAIGISLLMFNISRYGDPFNTGYLPNETFSGILWQGILGQLVSPGRGLLLFSPILILSIMGIIPALRQFRAEALPALSIILIHLLLYGKWFMWHGGFAWGPRFLIPTLPFWAILLTPIVARAFPDKTGVDNNPSGHTKFIRIAYIALVILSLLPQFLTTLLDFSPFQTYLINTGLPLFDPQTFFDIQYSPLLKGWQRFTIEPLDVAWGWKFEFNWILLAVLGVNVVVTGIYLSQAMRQRAGKLANRSIPHPVPRMTLPLLTTLTAVLSLLVSAHNLPDSSLQAAVTTLNNNVRSTDAVILNDPDITLDFAELYKGRAPVLGLNNGGFPLPDDVTERLDQIISQHRQVWWLPNWLPPADSAVEQTLLTTGFHARNDTFNQRRLGLFAFPQHLKLTPLEANTIFGKTITLYQVAYPNEVRSGTALPVELHWQAIGPITDNYHVFIHLVTPDDQIVTQTDGQPVLWTRPTSTWQPDETIVDRHGLWLPPNTTPGDYLLRIGLYQPETGERLRLFDETDAVQLILRVN